MEQMGKRQESWCGLGGISFVGQPCLESCQVAWLDGGDTPQGQAADAEAAGKRGWEEGASEQPKSIASRTLCCI